jgi:hypothetical protein
VSSSQVDPLEGLLVDWEELAWAEVGKGEGGRKEKGAEGQMGQNSGSWPDKPLAFHRGHCVQMILMIPILWPLQLIKPGGGHYYMLPNNI